MMHGHEKSDSALVAAIVATKPPNKAGQPAAEARIESIALCGTAASFTAGDFPPFNKQVFGFRSRGQTAFDF
jgi:hypothetical protein